jgi:Tfp pilus assembly protein PilO
MNMSVLFAFIKSDKGAFKNTHAQQILVGVLLLIMIFAYAMFVYLPQRDEIQQKRTKIEALPQLMLRANQVELSVQKAVLELQQAEKNYQALNNLFAVDSELEDLYKRLSQMADSQRLLISALTTDGEVAIFEGGKQQAIPPANQPVPPNQPLPNATGVNGKPAAASVPLFYRIKLKMELTGTYMQYMKYRRQLADFDKSLNIDKEQIMVIPNDSRGLVRVKAQISTVRIAQKLELDQPTQAPSATQSKMSYDVFEPRFIKIADVQKGQKPVDEVRQTERDPFSRASNGMIEGGRDPRISPLIMADPQSYVITGLIVSTTEKAAMIRTDFRENFIVRIGDPLGNQGGKIVEIDPNGIVVSQPSGFVRLYLQTQISQPAGMDGNRPMTGR